MKPSPRVGTLFAGGAVVVCLAVACGGSEAGGRDAGPAADGGEDPDGGAADADPGDRLGFLAGPTFTLAPNPAAPLTGLLELETSRPVRLAISIADPLRSFTVELPALASSHAVPVLGFRPATAHTVQVTATDETGEALRGVPIEVVTGPLPQNFPTFDSTVLAAGAIEPGVTVTGMRDWVIAVDQAGRVIWYAAVGPVTDVRRLPGGSFLVALRDIGGLEVDVFGNVLRRWHAANKFAGPPGSVPVALDTFHHELGVLPDGRLYTLATELRTYPDYPTSPTDPTPQAEPQALVGDLAVVFEPDGTLVSQWPLLDVLDPYRTNYSSFSDFWEPIYGPDTFDWSHGNAMIPDPSDGGFLISLRHQDAVVKLDADGQLVWILGPHENWGPELAPYLLTPVGEPFAWQFHQHAPEILASGNLLLFDNGNFRASPPDPPPPGNYSRAVEYAIDPVAMEVRQVWQYDAGGSLFAAATGDVDIGPVTGNVIVTFGFARRIVEVTHTAAPEAVFQLASSDAFYRAERLPSLYPDP